MICQDLEAPVTVSIELEKKLVETIKAACRRLNCSRSYLIARILEQYDFGAEKGDM